MKQTGGLETFERNKNLPYGRRWRDTVGGQQFYIIEIYVYSFERMLHFGLGKGEELKWSESSNY